MGIEPHVPGYPERQAEPQRSARSRGRPAGDPQRSARSWGRPAGDPQQSGLVSITTTRRDGKR
jgi:hypothetical protein